MVDFRFRNHGSVWQCVAVSNTAKKFAAEHFAVEGWQGTPDNFASDWRPMRDLSQRLTIEDNFNVEIIP
jgi:hypothetical protein